MDPSVVLGSFPHVSIVILRAREPVTTPGTWLAGIGGIIGYLDASIHRAPNEPRHPVRKYMLDGLTAVLSEKDL
jgi:hypothetical protein